ARPLDVVLQEVPGTGRYHDLGETNGTETVPGLIAYRVYSPLFFANAEHFVQRARHLVLASPRLIRCFVIDMQAVWEIDITAADALVRLAEEFKKYGVSIWIARANRPLRERLEQMGLGAHFDQAAYFPSVHAAVTAYQNQTDPAQSTAQPA